MQRGGARTLQHDMLLLVNVRPTLSSSVPVCAPDNSITPSLKLFLFQHIHLLFQLLQRGD
jgi:hypothetical protein